MSEAPDTRPVMLYRLCPACEGEAPSACLLCEDRGFIEAGLELHQVAAERAEARRSWHRAAELALVVRQVVAPVVPLLDDASCRTTHVSIGMQWLRKLRLALEVFEAGRRGAKEVAGG